MIINKNKIFSTTLIFLGLLFAGSALASDLTLELESDPLFENANFLPGNSVERWAKVTNNSAEERGISAEAINWVGFPYIEDVPATDLSRALNIVIKEGSTELYSGTLFDFYKRGETFLSNVPAGDFAEYDFKISFPEGSGNDWQGKNTGFDILIGFLGEGTPQEIINNGGGGGLRGLTIAEPIGEKEITETSITLTWMTNYDSTSEVVYGNESEAHTFDFLASQYGYAHTTGESDLSKVTVHSVTITGLTPNTTYYYRCISHGSFAMSTEYSFTTLGTSGIEEEIEKIVTEKEREGIFLTDEELENLKQEIINSIQTRTSGEGSELNDEEKEELIARMEEIASKEAKDGSDLNSSKFAASLLGLMDSGMLSLSLIFLLLLFILLFLLLETKKEEKNRSKRLALLTILIFLIIFYIIIFAIYL